MQILPFPNIGSFEVAQASCKFHLLLLYSKLLKLFPNFNLIWTILADKWKLWNLCRSNSWVNHHSLNANKFPCVAMCASHSSMMSSSGSYENCKKVWIWTQSKEVMTASVERGWNTFVFSSRDRQLVNEWSCKLPILPLLLLFSLNYN